MGIRISYMGTKRRLAHVVSDLVQNLPEGPMLDAFSGMCAVGEAIGLNRQIWTNDIQPFPALVGELLFCSRSELPSSAQIKQILQTSFIRNLRALEHRFNSHLETERKYFDTRAFNDVLAGNTELPYVGNDHRLEQERKRLAKKPKTFPYRLATITYIGSFFGVTQCMEIDSLCYAIDFAVANKQIDSEQKAWLTVALGQVLTRINNSTGQFAQFIKPKRDNIDRILEKRRRSVWNEFFLVLDAISPLGTEGWRLNNRAFKSDALSLLSDLENYESKPSVIYADPPYSEAQYSRYYHVLDVLVEYRYPPISGDGRYPDRRFQTPFALASAVSDSMIKLIERTSKLEASLILSYPENGLFIQKGGNLIHLLKRYYRHADIAFSDMQKHSTFGGPEVASKVSVVENVYLAYN